MNARIAVLVLLMLASQHKALGFYIRSSEESTAPKSDVSKAHNDDWGLFKNTLGLTKEKVELLKSQKDQQGTKELLTRFIKENPKYLSAATSKKPNRPHLQFKRLFRALISQLKGSNSMLKTSFNFELADKPQKPLKRARRKIAVKMVSDMSSERVDHLLKMFYQKHNLQPLDYETDNADQANDDGDYIDADLPSRSDTDLDSDYAYDNLYDDEGDVDLTAKSRQNLEYGSFQDLILQAKRNQWERESEETKLHSPRSEHFI
ncbi:hypothetical protein KR222_008692 [Zaprionus bogoriensis]|nr:hypothetical protein KR222_008692 [Zaprionus bogoriensis]